MSRLGRPLGGGGQRSLLKREGFLFTKCIHPSNPNDASKQERPNFGVLTLSSLTFHCHLHPLQAAAVILDL